ncbi:MAG TPA: glutamine synthetase family protein [Ktedonobacteraceae bacterium]|nr:glutamine synthetase family protein [Ktedonobacteraceae bacterium]
MNVQEVLQLVRSNNLRLVRFQYCDNGGIIRAKATHATKLESRMQEGIGQTRAMQAFSGVENLTAVEGMLPVGEFRLVPDPQTFSILPYAPHTASMMCDMIDLDGSPWEACPRTFLKRMMARLAEHGMRAEAGIEHEFYLAKQREDGTFEPADQSLCYSTIGLDEQAEVVDATLAALESQGISIELFHTEYGPAQEELSLRHNDILRTADNTCLVRETVRGIARKFDLFASFAPKPFLNLPGSGAHIHCSLWKSSLSESETQNLFYDPDQRGGFSQLGKYFVGGVLKHLRGLLAITCASPNSYARLQPHFWSSAYITYGYDNREGAIRIPSLFKGREAHSANIELKSADHSANPYLALGALLAAGLDGIQNKIDPGYPEEVDPGLYTDEERRQRGIERFPLTLAESLDALEKDEVLLEALGPLLARSYLSVKRAEFEFFQDKPIEAEILQHFYKY